MLKWNLIFVKANSLNIRVLAVLSQSLKAYTQLHLVYLIVRGVEDLWLCLTGSVDEGCNIGTWGDVHDYAFRTILD